MAPTPAAPEDPASGSTRTSAVDTARLLPQVSGRHHSLDGIRALACLMVLVVHVATETGDSLAPGPVGALLSAAVMGVPLFFALSGVLLYRPWARAALDGTRGPDTRSYLWRRVMRIFPAYWVVAVVALLLYAGEHLASVRHWAEVLTLTFPFNTSPHWRGPGPEGLGQMWSLSVEVAFYLTLPLFAVFLARPCPFYILDEVEAALDDANIDRFLQLIRRFADRAQFVIVTHQKRTMDAADLLYGVSMGGDGVTKVVSRNAISGSSDEAIDTEAFATSEMKAFVANNNLSLSGVVPDFRARAINAGSTFCLELINNFNATLNTTFRVENNTGAAGAFQIFENANDNLAVRNPLPPPDLFTSIAQGVCNIPLDGVALFEANCAKCHTGNGLGREAKKLLLARDITGRTATQINAQFTTTPNLSMIETFVVNGRLTLTQQEIANLEAYIMGLNGVDRGQLISPGMDPKHFFITVAAAYFLLILVRGGIRVRRKIP